VTGENCGGDAERLEREAERVADRLRVLGPRWAGRVAAADGVALAAVRSSLQRLADLAADTSGEPRRPVPQLAPRALPDQVLVLAHEASSAGASAAADEVLVELRRAL
jgi:hypothetical protein